MPDANRAPDPQKDRVSADQPLNMIYVVGTGRCGTTFLDVMLGQQPGMWTVGELHLLKVWLDDEAEKCGCNKPVADCDFWKEVCDQVLPSDVTELGLLRREPRPRGKAFRWSYIFGNAAERNSKRYARANLAILGAIKAAAENRKAGPLTLVDASKDIYRLQLLLAGAPSDKLRIKAVHVWRDPAGFAANMSDRKKLGPKFQSGPLKLMNVLRYATRWRIENRLFLKAMAKMPAEDRLVINFDDLARDWVPNAARLTKRLGGNVDEEKFAHTRFDVNHGISGNSPRWSKLEPRKPKEPDFLGRYGEMIVKLVCSSTRDLLADVTTWNSPDADLERH